MDKKPSYDELEKRIAHLEEEARAHDQAMSRLQNSKDKYKTLVENSLEGIFVAQDGQIKFANITTMANAGYGMEELSTKPFIEFIHPDDREMVFERHIKRQNGETPPSRYAFRIITRSGDIQWVEINVVQIQWEGNPATLNFMTDITKRKKAEEDLLASEERFRSMVEKSPIGVAIVNDHFQYVYLNERFCSILGFPAEELLGAEFTARLSEESRDQSIEWYLRRQKGEKVPDQYQVSFIRKSGETGYGEVQSAVYVDSKGRPHSIIQVSDVTERMKAEMETHNLENQLRQAQKMESVGRLAGGVAHDFNNMLSVILGHTEIAMTYVSKENSLYTNLTEILKACRRSAEFTQQLLAFARKQTIAPKVMDLNQWVSGTLKMLQRLIGEDKELVWIPGHGLWPVKMDPAQIDQILANMAVNAHDAISGVGKVIVETHNTVFDEIYCSDHAGFIPGEYVMLGVSDNGCGMPKNTLDMIFEPFFTTKEVGKGTGLGLATVYGIVKQNNGFINVYSEPGTGTTFRMYFPRNRSNLQGSLKKEEEKAATGGTETVLLVEDEPAILSMGKNILERLGYTVITSSTPGEAIRLAREYSGRIHLLITDVVMPEMNGKELSERLLHRNPKLKCLFMSGYTANVIAHRGVLEGGVHFIQKPFSSRELDKKIREILDQGNP